MDPTSPKNNPSSPLPNSGPSVDPIAPTAKSPVSTPPPMPSNVWSPMEQPQSGGPQPTIIPDGAGPIEPGQFVQSGDDTPISSSQGLNLSSSAGNQPIVPPAQTPDLSPHVDYTDSQLTSSSSKDQLITPPSNSSQGAPEPVLPPQSPLTGNSQPDPTPFTQPSPGSSDSGFSKPPGGGIKKLRLVIIILGIVTLVLIIGAIAWFFFLSKPGNEAAKTENQTQESPAVSQQPIPKRGQGGFDQIQNTATSSGQLQESTAGASGAKTP